NGPLYAVYEAETLFSTLALARIEHANLLGSLTWAFEFEEQPYFEAFAHSPQTGWTNLFSTHFECLACWAANVCRLRRRLRYPPRRWFATVCVLIPKSMRSPPAQIMKCKSCFGITTTMTFLPPPFPSS